MWQCAVLCGLWMRPEISSYVVVLCFGGSGRFERAVRLADEFKQCCSPAANAMAGPAIWLTDCVCVRIWFFFFFLLMV